MKILGTLSALLLLAAPAFADEAVELAKRYSTEDAGRFVNGVLAAVARSARPAA